MFDKVEATEDNQTWVRAYCLGKIRNALGKHAIEEENVIYPALREANQAHDADALNGEHGYIKTFLYELDTMPKDGSAWLDKMREFRTMLEEHMRMEEEQVFPAFRASMTEEQSARLFAAMQREGMKLAYLTATLPGNWAKIHRFYGNVMRHRCGRRAHGSVLCRKCGCGAIQRLRRGRRQYQ